MDRLLLIAIAVIAVGAPAAAQTIVTAPSPAPVKIAAAKVTDAWGFTNRIRIPTGSATTVSSAECDRRAVGITAAGQTMSLSGATDSRTLVAVPIGAGNASAATTQQQISDVCDRR